MVRAIALAAIFAAVLGQPAAGAEGGDARDNGKAPAETDENALRRILMVGLSGAGKSTSIVFFDNVSRRCGLSNPSYAIQLKNIDNVHFPASVNNLNACIKHTYKEITLIRHADEAGGVGSSAQANGMASDTHQITGYEMAFENRRFEFIDTAGLFDTRGNEQDKNNYNAIIEVLRALKEIHGILFVVNHGERRANDEQIKKITNLLDLFPASARKQIAVIVSGTSRDSEMSVNRNVLLKLCARLNPQDPLLAAGNKFIRLNCGYLTTIPEGIRQDLADHERDLTTSTTQVHDLIAHLGAFQKITMTDWMIYQEILNVLDGTKSEPKITIDNKEITYTSLERVLALFEAQDKAAIEHGKAIAIYEEKKALPVKQSIKKVSKVVGKKDTFTTQMITLNNPDIIDKAGKLVTFGLVDTSNTMRIPVMVKNGEEEIIGEIDKAYVDDKDKEAHETMVEKAKNEMAARKSELDRATEAAQSGLDSLLNLFKLFNAYRAKVVLSKNSNDFIGYINDKKAKNSSPDRAKFYVEIEMALAK